MLQFIPKWYTCGMWHMVLLFSYLANLASSTTVARSLVAEELTTLSEPCPLDITPNIDGFTMDEVRDVAWLCCMCPPGTYMSKPCKYQEPATRVCTPCTFITDDVNQQFYSSNHAHTQTYCNKSQSVCSIGFDHIPGNRSLPAECREQPKTTTPPAPVLTSTAAPDVPSTGQNDPEPGPKRDNETGGFDGWHVGFIVVSFLLFTTLILTCFFPHLWARWRSAICSLIGSSNQERESQASNESAVALTMGDSG